MMDLERLTEAYADEPYETERDADLHRALGKGKFAPWERDIERLLVRNAQYRDLLANGERVWWCEEHNGQGVPSLGRDPERCWKTAMKHVDPGHCRMTSRLLVDPPKEEGT